MTLLPPDILQALSRSKILTTRAEATGGIGERRSKATGPGIEFADHRPYQLGDDIRYLDRHAHARLGQLYVRQFAAYQQLPVTVLLDASASMDHGAKFELAVKLAGALAYIGLVGSDRVQVATFSDDRVRWSEAMQGTKFTEHLFSWLERTKTYGRSHFIEVAKQVTRRLTPRGILIMISDLMSEEVDAATRLLDRAEQELVLIHVLHPAELDPRMLGEGEVTLVDAETGSAFDVSLSTDTYEQYKLHVQNWQDRMRRLAITRNGRYFGVSASDGVRELLLARWRSEGLIA